MIAIIMSNLTIFTNGTKHSLLASLAPFLEYKKTFATLTALVLFPALLKFSRGSRKTDSEASGEFVLELESYTLFFMLIR